MANTIKQSNSKVNSWNYQLPTATERAPNNITIMYLLFLTAALHANNYFIDKPLKNFNPVVMLHILSAVCKKLITFFQI